MDFRLKTFLAMALSAAAGSVAAQTAATSVQVAPERPSATSGVAGASAVGGAVATPAGGLSAASDLPALGATMSAPKPAGAAAAVLPGRAASAPAVAVPATAAPAAGRAPAKRASASPRAGASPPSAAAGAALGGAVRNIAEARRSDGGGLSVSRALDRVFDAALGRAALDAGIAARRQDARGAIAQKVEIANSASPADAPDLYQDAIRTAKEVLTAPAADGVARVVRSFAARKAETSLSSLATAAYRAAAAASQDETGASAAETGRLLSAFDKWESLLGAPGRPLISNAAALKNGAGELLRGAPAGGGRSAPHVWFARKNGAYTAMLPVTPVAGLAAAFAIAPSAPASGTALGDAYRAYRSDPRASTGAGLVYRARRTFGESVPSALSAAAEFWLRTALKSLWSRIVGLFAGEAAYRLSLKSDQDALRRDAALAGEALRGAASARRMLSDRRLTVAGVRAAFAALASAADAHRGLTGDGDAAAAVAAARRSFESAAAGRGLSPGGELPAFLDEYVSGPGSAAHWAERVEAEASRALDRRFWRSRSTAGALNLGSESGPAVAAAAAARAAAGVPLESVALDDRLWARGRGVNGEARLSAELRATASGGAVELRVESGGEALARRLEDIGLTVFPEGAGLRAVVGSEDFARGADEIGALAARALAAALGRDQADDGGALRELVSEVSRDPAALKRLAAELDGREAFSRAPVIGLVGGLEALAPTPVGADMIVSLRDPATGLLAYARALAPRRGAPPAR